MLNFRNAETLHMSAAKLLTGKDAPMSQMEMVLWNTYRVVQERMEQQRKPAGRR